MTIVMNDGLAGYLFGIETWPLRAERSRAYRNARNAIGRGMQRWKEQRLARGSLAYRPRDRSRPCRRLAQAGSASGEGTDKKGCARSGKELSTSKRRLHPIQYRSNPQLIASRVSSMSLLTPSLLLI
jgi:hypothetical protein